MINTPAGTLDHKIKDVIYTDSSIKFINGRKCITCKDFDNWGKLELELVTRIGRGSAGEVWAARRITPKGAIQGMPEEFAVKVIDLVSARHRFQYERGKYKVRREVSIMAALRHSGVVALYGAVETQTELFLIMEYVKCGDLFNIINKNKLTYDQIRFVVYQIVLTLKYVHSKGIIHRDLKLENILIDRAVSPGYYIVKITDFGLSKFVGPEFAATSFVGTPQYWAPEIILTQLNPGASPYGTSADVWSLGCLMYVLIGMWYPFEAAQHRQMHGDDGDSERQRNILSGKVQYNSNFDRGDYKDLIKKILVVDVNKRATLNMILAHPFMTEARGHDVPALYAPEVTGIDNPLLVTAGTVLKCLSTEPVLKDRVDGTGNLGYGIQGTHEKDIRNVKEQNNMSAVGESRHMKGGVSLTNIFEGLRTEMAFQRDSKPASRIGMIAEKLDQNLGNPIDASQGCGPMPIDNTAFNKKCSEGEEKAEVIFDPAELVELQLSIMKHLQWTYLAYRNNLDVAPRIAQSMRQYRQLTKDSGIVMHVFDETCYAVLEMLPDLKLAVSEKLPELAIGLFEDILNVSRKMLNDAERIRKDYHDLINYLDQTLLVGQRLKLQYDIEVVNLHNQGRFGPGPAKAIKALDISPFNEEQTHSHNEGMTDENTETVHEESLERHQIFNDIKKFCEDEQQEPAPSDLTSKLFDKLLFNSPSTDPASPNTSLEGAPSKNESVPEISESTNNLFREETAVSMDDQTQEEEMLPLYDRDGMVKKSKILRNALNELRRVDSILSAITTFWENIKLTIEQMLNMRSHAARLLAHSNQSEAFARRFYERLDTYISFWESLRGLCQSYVGGLRTASPIIHKMLHEVEGFRDSLDTLTTMIGCEPETETETET